MDRTKAAAIVNDFFADMNPYGTVVHQCQSHLTTVHGSTH